MGDPLLMAVGDTGNQLMEEGTSDRILEWTGEGEEVEQLTAGGQLKDDQNHLNLGAILLLISRIPVDILETNHIRVIDLLHSLNLTLDLSDDIGGDAHLLSFDEMAEHRREGRKWRQRGGRGGGGEASE